MDKVKNKRERYTEYYLEQAIDEPILLYPDGTVGELKQKEVEITEKIPSRVPERLHDVTRIAQGLSKTAMHNSLGEYIGYLNQNRQDSSSDIFEHVDWTLDDIPPSVVKQYTDWRDAESDLNLDDIIKSAGDVSFYHETYEGLDEKIQCQYCKHDEAHQYNCYVCGTSRQFYKYPLVRFKADDGNTIDKPFDISEAIADRPDLLSVTDSYSISSQGGILSGKKELVFDIDSYTQTDRNTGKQYTLDPSDKVYREGLRLVIDTWSENSNIRSMNGEKSARTISNWPPQTSTQYINALQEKLSSYIAKEKPSGDEYQKRYDRLLRQAGQKGIGLTFEYAYMGMGETDAVFYLAENDSDPIQRQAWAMHVDIREALASAARYT